ncbi:MAG: zinc-ribbon domain-containing protein [Halobacteriota archaeon]|nr:zinc-ribbon domain-containing protein [Halobacteriota archaeon]
MAYCPKCGKQNEDNAKYCNDCGANLTGKRDREQEWEDRCEEECSGGSRHGSLFWGLIITFVGLFIVFEFGLKNIEGLPAWVYDISLGWIIPVIIGIAILIAGIRIITKRD